MDTAVALVQAYLNVNGYFTVSEYPILRHARQGPSRSATDIDLLAFRFPGAGREVSVAGHGRAAGDVSFETDPALEAPRQRPDMIVAEVKEGPAALNPAARDPLVLAAALARFGCCQGPEVRSVVDALLHHGRATTRGGHVVRLVAFGSSRIGGKGGSPPHLVVPIERVVDFLQEHLRSHWSELGHADLKHPAMSFLALLEKAHRGRSTGS